MNCTQLKSALLGGAYDERFSYIYGIEAVKAQVLRYCEAVDAFAARYGADREVTLYSVAGRSELSGNHTDHNHGCVIAASIDLDIIAVASPNEGSVIRIESAGFPEDVVDVNAYTAPDPARYETSASLIAGMAAGFRREGYAVGGFDAYTTSNVLKGSGMSSSAAFEDMVGNILSHLYNGGKVDNVTIAKLAQYAENEFFGKPCGLMDQVACAVGGIVAIDFADPKNPIIDKIDLDMSAEGYNLCIVSTGGNHADLTGEYASITVEMREVANYFGKSFMREVTKEELIAAIPALRERVGDRAIMRGRHFLNENERVATQKSALLARDLDRFFDCVLASGRSSFCYLQNVYTSLNLREQGLSLALCLAEGMLTGERAAWRVHGGGFAGTIQAFVPTEKVEEFRRGMDAAFGEGRCMVLRIRPVGAVKI